MAIIEDDHIVVDWNEGYNDGFYEVSITTQDAVKKQDPLTSLIIRSPIIRNKHLSYRMLYDAKELPKLEDSPTYKEFYDVVAGIYRSCIYEKIEGILDGHRLENSQCDIYAQCELNNFVAQQTPDGVEWNQANLSTLMVEFGRLYSCDLTFKGPDYDILNITQYNNPDRCCTIQAIIIRSDIGIANLHHSF